MNITDAQREIRTRFVGGFYGQLVSAVLWLASVALAVWSSPRAAITTLVVGGFFIFPACELLIRVFGPRASLSPANSLRHLGMQVAFVLPLSMPLLLPVGQYRLNWFYPAMMILLGAHYVPFVFLYGMRMFAVLAALLVGGGVLIALYASSSFSLGAWYTAAILLVFAVVGRAIVQQEGRQQAAPQREDLLAQSSQALLSVILLLGVTGGLSAQQVADLKYKPPVPRPAYGSGKGPRVAIDEAHHNYHTADGRYKPFAELLRRDGYRVDGFRKPFSSASLAGLDVLVIANPLHESNAKDWSLPTPSAFTKEEIAALCTWVQKGGSLFLIADHMPFGGAAADLARAFKVEFSNGFARPGKWEQGKPDTWEGKTGLPESAVTRGRSDDEKVTRVTTFTGSAFKPPRDAKAVLVFGADSVSLTPKTAWKFTAETPKVPIEGWCQGAVMKVGKGRVAVFGEAAMFTAQLSGATKRPMGMNAPVAKQNHQLLLNVMHWLTRARGMPE
jgi:hypothetical protein